jgi:hypothetical protein
MIVRNTARNERGVAYPSPVVMLTIIAVAMAAVAFVATRGAGSQEREITPVAQPRPTTSSVAPTPTPTPTAPIKKKPPAIQRGKIFVEVYNNTGITGLAGRVAGQAAGAGWQVVGSDNWVGTIPASTVYFPPKLARAGKQLALDLGIRRVQPAVDPMKLDRLTIILTGDVG